MGDFRQGGGKRFGGGGGRGGGFGGRSGGRGGFGGGRDRGPVTMHQAVCDECKKPCEVPFRPSSGKPVYCNACFGGKKETGSNRDFRDDRFSAPVRTDNNEVKNQLEMLNVKMDRLIKAVEAMANVKPLVKTVPVIKTKKSVKKASKS
ncbi:MAG: CxxC-x17-CxxC domain-containing protein [Candidatus Paceibacterota bacterium]|jgi:CxxC-x17-CxxC domain-containing protein